MEEKVEELIPSSGYSDNVNTIGYSLKKLEKVSEIFIKAFKKYFLFLKPSIESFLIYKKYDERLK